MGLLFSGSVGHTGQFQHRPLTALGRLHALIAAAQSQKDIGRTLHEIKQLLAEHPELKWKVPDDIQKPPRLVVDNVLPLSES